MTSAVDRSLIIGQFDDCLFPSGSPEPQTAWLGIYQTLWWFDDGVLHIREANDLRKPLWQQRASALQSYIESELAAATGTLEHYVDRMMRLPRWNGMQRNNPVGNGLRVLVSEYLRRWGDSRFRYEEEQNATKWFPGIQMAGRSATPRLDVGVIRRGDGRPRAVLSCKWSIRHDRVSDPTNECTAYKAAAAQQQIFDLGYYVVTNELDAQRLDKIVGQPCVDGLVHVHLRSVEIVRGSALPASLTVARENGRLLDLADMPELTGGW